MASRRLAISSLLCDGDNEPERPRSHDGDELNYISRSPLPAAAPPPSHQGDRHDELQTSTPTTFAIFDHDARRIPVDDHRQPGPDALGPPRHQALTTRSITPLPLALQPAIVQHRTPSPPPMSLPASPVEQDGEEVDYYDDDERVISSADPYSRSFRDYPSTAVAHTAYATHATTSYSQYSSPPSSSSGNAVEISLGRPSLPVSSFRFSPPVPRRPLPVDTTHEYVQAQAATYQAGHSISPAERVANVHSGVEQSTSRVANLTVNTLDGRHFHAGVSRSPIHSRPLPSAGLSGLDALVQAATEERERIDEHRRRSGGSDRQQPTRDERGLAGHAQSPVSAGSSRTQRLSPEWRARPLQSQGHEHYHGFPETPLAEQPRTIYNYAAQDAHSTKRRRSTPNISPAVESDAKSTLSNAIHRSQQISPHEFPRPSTSMHIGHENMDAALTDLHVAASMEELSLARALPSQSQPSPIYGQHQSADELFPSQRRASGPSVPTSVPGHSHGRRTPPRSKPKSKPGSAALNAVEKMHSRELVADSSSQEYRKQTHSSRKAHKHEIQKEVVEDVDSAKSTRQHASSKRASSGRSALKDDFEGDERDAHDFFLSVFDSPRQGANRQPQPEDSISHAQKHIREQHTSSHIHGSDMGDEFIGATRGSSYEEPGDEGDVEEELADAVADTEYETGEERGDNILSEFADTMDVDVEDELLSLVEPVQSNILHTAQDLPQHSRASFSKETDVRHPDHGRLSPGTRDRLSMPPPTTTKGVKGGKTSKGDSSSKHAAPSKATGSSKEVKLSKKLAPKTEESLAKATKAKAAPKPKPKASSEKLKVSKHVLETAEVETPGPIATTSTTATPAPAEEPFPTVTSSGRMVKKSMASTLAAQSVAVSSKKKTSGTASMAHAEGSNPRSRSHSVMPRASVDPEPDKQSKADDERVKEDEDVLDEEDKLYCICRTKYDEDRVMIACDRCDEWYHTQCVKMPDLQVDLVDQFICPTCVKRNPGLHLKTTYKQRCFTGLKHPKPNSADACHKPARGAYSKYCSDECGVKYMHMKLQTWTNKGGDVERLWENVKDAKRREGVVVREPGRTLPKKILAELSNVTPPTSTRNQASPDPDMHMNIDQPGSITVQENGVTSTSNPVSKQKIDSLEAQLRKVVSEREDRKKEMEVVEWRQRLLSLAIARADRVGECGWDQRLCFGDEEWREFGEGVLESYEDVSDGMEVDELESEWWCRGEKKCERHAGWQKLRDRELNNEREERNDVLVQLTTREREIRNRIEDILHPKAQGDTATTPKLPLMMNSLNIMNGREEGGKKKKKGGR